MGFWDTILSSGFRLFAPRTYYIGGMDPQELTSSISGMSAAKLWRSQPHLRTVIGFRARNVAQLGLHVYRREADGGRVRDRTSSLARTLGGLSGGMTSYERIFALIGDYDLHDRAFWLVVKDADAPSDWTIRRLPPGWVQPHYRGTDVDHWLVTIGDKTVKVPLDQMLYFPGYDPSSVTGCSSTVEALKSTLQEQVESALYRGKLWKNGGRVSSVLQRPLEAPEWSKEAREAFREDWYAKYTGNGPFAGGTPILEDGMTLGRVDFSAADQQFVEAARLSLQTVAAAYFVEPTMVGMGEGATYSNLRAYRKMLYTETLGPLLAQIEDRVNSVLVPMFGMDPAEYYVEFNIAEKLQGDFEEQAAVLSTATGRPWMTANEARARQNMTALPGGDQLVVPLNVLVGGQSSPRDSGSQNRVADPVEEDHPKSAGVLAKAKPAGLPQPTIDKHAEVLTAFFRRQGKAVSSRIGAGADDWWDEERWDGELSEDLLRLARMTSTDAATAALKAAGLNPDDYDVDRTMAFLREASKRNAHSINAATRAQIENLDDPSDVEQVNGVFDTAESGRAGSAAATLVAFAVGFGTVESGKQTGAVTKTWVVTSGNPRPSHAAIDGETVGIEDTFSNGCSWPGSGSYADEVAGCDCLVQMGYGSAS